MSRSRIKFPRKHQPAPAQPTAVDHRVNLDIFRFSELVCAYRDDSTAQLHQDLWVLHESGRKRDGYFVEFGAANGVDLSNTWLLENHFDWQGILADPNPDFHDELKANRPSAGIDQRAVYSRSKEILPLAYTNLGEYSSLQLFADRDFHADMRAGAGTTPVETVSLDDLLDHHGAPDEIDYMSVDTEGGELQILENFDFAKRRINLITVEHNFTPDREKIFELLTAKGYERRFTEFSQYDDWYRLAPPT